MTKDLGPDTLAELPDAFDVTAVAGDYIRDHAAAWESLARWAKGLEIALGQAVATIETLNETLEEVGNMVIAAHDACHSEYMGCPWCSGHIGEGDEWHDDYCRWPAFIDYWRENEQHTRT